MTRRGHKPRILIVEDDPYTLDLYKESFTKAGFDVIPTGDADGYFLEMVIEQNPDIISMDIMIGKDGKPGERNGLEALKLLKGDLRTYEIPVMILSHFFEEEKVNEAKALGAVDYLNAAAYTPSNIPEHYLNYLKHKKRYRPTHPTFREAL